MAQVVDMKLLEQWVQKHMDKEHMDKELLEQWVKEYMATGRKPNIPEDSPLKIVSFMFNIADFLVPLEHEPLTTSGEHPCTTPENPEDNDMAARFISPCPGDPKYDRYAIMVNDTIFNKQHRGRFAGTWLHPWMERQSNDQGDAYYLALYVYKLQEEYIEINGVSTKFLNRRSGGDGVVGQYEFKIGEERFELLETLVEEEELVCASGNTVDDSYF